MKALKKILLIVVILVVVLGIAAVVLAGVFLDKIVKTGVETVAPTITQTTVTLDSVHISLMSGSAAINGRYADAMHDYDAQREALDTAGTQGAPCPLLL